MSTLKERALMSKEIGWGLIGASNVAREWLIPAMNAASNSKVVAVLGSDLARTQRYAADNNVPAAYDDLATLLNDPAVTAVYISTTNERHAPAAIAAAKARKHVLCEKPMALSLDDARAMLEAAKSAGVRLGVNHHLRCMETHRTIRRLVSDGAVGNIVAVRLFFGVTLPDDLKGWRVNNPQAGGGVLFDLTVHDADLIRFLLADEPLDVVALTGATGVAQAGLPDTAMIAARMKSGLLLQIGESFSIAHADTSLEIHGTRGSILANDVLMQRGGGTVFLRRESALESINIQHANAYPRVIEQFNNAIRGEGDPSASGEDGFASLAFALAARESAATGRVVRVPQLSA
jgi:1,5-anhydro-D-fructose reductase (1,5-anhydro-D-mannitol-forming)